MAKEIKIQWHPAFCSAMELTFMEDAGILSFNRENNLSSKPLQVDLLVIDKEPGKKLHNDIGYIFKAHNIIEYKSPEDELNIDTYYKVIGYGCIYKALTGKKVNETRAEDITLTLLRHYKPVKLFNELKQYDVKIAEKYPGIYYLSGKVLFDTQIIVSDELSANEHIWLKALTNKLDKNEARKLIESLPPKHGDEKNEDAKAVMQVVLNANWNLFENLRKEDPVMNDFVSEFFKDDIEKKDRERISNLIKAGASPELLYNAYDRNMVDEVSRSVKKVSLKKK